MFTMDTQKWLSIGTELIGSVKNQFPSHADYEPRIDNGNFVCRINWKLNNDINRPSKRSRIILVRISNEALEDADYDNNQAILHERFTHISRGLMKKFEFHIADNP